MNLVIVESPAKCSKIQGFLGQGWKVIATMGHIRALKQHKDAIGINNNFNPIYEWLPKKSIKSIKESAAQATTIYLASDDDREGEFISYSLCILLGIDPSTTLRAVFHEITATAVIHAISNPRLVNMDIVNAQQSRAILDMLIGFTISPLLWKHVAMSLSAGRCQTPALRFIIEKENMIRDHKQTMEWKMAGIWKYGGKELGAYNIQSTLSKDFVEESTMMSYLHSLHTTHTTTISTNTISDWTLRAPPPLMTSTLQQQASSIYGINPKQAMQIAQKLYEAGHITYMRTDKNTMCDEAIKKAGDIIRTKLGKEYVICQSPNKTSQKSAHEAIRPTHFEIEYLQEPGWTGREKNIYHLIWQRAIQSVMTPAKGQQCKIQFDIEGRQWSSQTRKTTFQGWQCINGRPKDLDGDNEYNDENEIPSQCSIWDLLTTIFIPGTPIEWTSLSVVPHISNAVSRYTEATLIREMETHGIGRPSTFASILESLQERQYVEIKDIDGKEIHVQKYEIMCALSVWPPTPISYSVSIGKETRKLVPTDIGRTVLVFLLSHFSDLFDYTFTANMEKRLDMIADGAEEWKTVLVDTWDSYKDRYNTLISGADTSGGHHAKVRIFKDGLKAVSSNKGPLLLIEIPGATPKSKPIPNFLGWPEGGISFQELTEEQAIQFRKMAEQRSISNIVGQWNGHDIIKKYGKFGYYVSVDALKITTSISESDTFEEIVLKLNNANNKIAKKFKEYEIRNGPYGPYIYKPALKKKVFVAIPKNTDIDTITEAEVNDIYMVGKDKKKRYIYKNKNKVNK